VSPGHRPSSRRALCAPVVAGILALLGTLAPTPQALCDDRRIVAVGDVHGSLEGLRTILEEAELIDRRDLWRGGDTILVQTGDVLDRGADVRGVLELLRGLQTDAAQEGGRVVVLLGNHEAMNLLGIFRDVNREAYTSFAGEGSEVRRLEEWRRYREFWTRRARELGRVVEFSDDAREQFLAMHPVGFFEYADAMDPSGRDGRWLRSLPVAVTIDDTLFIHAGYGPELGGLTIDELNRRAAEEITTYDHLRAEMVEESLALPWYSVADLAREVEREKSAVDALGPAAWAADPERVRRLRRLEPLVDWESWLLVDPEGPLWFRGADIWADGRRAEMLGLLDGLGVQRMVVGHTVQHEARITPRFGGRVFLIDTGMLRPVYGGGPSALEIRGDMVTAIYPGAREILAGAGAPSSYSPSSPPPIPVDLPSGNGSPSTSTSPRSISTSLAVSLPKERSNSIR
jgi:hypothetical protein